MTRSRPPLRREAKRRSLIALRDVLLALDPQGDIEEFFAAAARALMQGTRARACGLSRRFPGVSQDLFLLVLPDREPLRRLLPLGREDRHQRLPLPGKEGDLPGFHAAGLRELAALARFTPERVVFVPVSYGGLHVVDIELADPDPVLVPGAKALAGVLADTAVVFRVAVLQERLRRERLEAQLLHALGRELGRTFDLQDLLATILDLLRQVVPFDAAAIYVLERGGLEVVHETVRGYDANQALMARVNLNQGLVGYVARTGEATLVPDVEKDPRYFNTRPATRSELVAPLKSGGRVIGVFNLESDRFEAYTPHDLELVATFAGQAAAALERARLLEEEEQQRRIEQELRIARRIQQTFLPDAASPRRRGRLAGKTLFSTEVSGDYYDFLEREDGSVAVALADVAGKGIPAALIMSSLRAAFRLGATHHRDPAALCAELNNFLVASLRDTEFVTGVFGFLDAGHRTFRFANAGHNYPLLLRADGSHAWLEEGGMLLGAFPGREYPTTSVDLGRGDLLVLYTDGVTEAHAGDHDEFGTERLLEVARAGSADGPEGLIAGVIAAVRDFVDGPLPDDLTLVVIAGGEENADG
jgi:sigma-B regulation protein RsbU (phosphoserine phosphatase)